MKKLLSIFAAGALALGLIGCSGDLHDLSEIDMKNGACPGAMNGWNNTSVWTSVNGSTYTYEFTAGAAEAEWKAIAVSGNWNSGAFGGGENTVTKTPVGETTDLTYDGATGGYKNAKITGMEIGSKYRITLTVDVTDAKAKIECIKAVPKFSVLVKNEDKVESKEMSPVNEGKGYQYIFKADEAGTLDFAIYGGNMLYYSAAKDIELGTPEDVTPEYDDPTTYTSFAYTKGEWLISVDVSAGYENAVLSVKYAALLKNYFWAINGPMGIAQITDSDGDGTYTVEFVATKQGWMSDADKAKYPNGMNFTIYAHRTEAAVLDSAKWWDGTVYRFGGFEIKVNEKTTCKTDGENATLNPVTDGATYVAEFTSDANNVYVTVSLKE